MAPQRPRALGLELAEQALVVLGHPRERPARLELDDEEVHLALQRRVGAADAGALGGVDERAVDAIVRGDDVAPRRVGLVADGAEVLDRLAHGVRDAVFVALEHEMGGLELERGAQLEQVGQALARERGHAGAAVGLELDEALVGEGSERGAQAVAGDAVALGQLAFDQALAGGEVAVEDAPAQRARQRVDGRDALELGVHGQGHPLRPPPARSFGPVRGARARRARPA
jgi:hypothetical protein